MLSLIFWSLMLVVSVKYVGFILRADNRGEGGMLALLALHPAAAAARRTTKRARALLIALGLFGGALLYGDGIITPAISVLGAVEGLEVAAPALARFVVPITVVILVGALLLSSASARRRSAASFGPDHARLVRHDRACSASRRSCTHPAILAALNPWHAVRFFLDHPHAASSCSARSCS